MSEAPQERLPEDEITTTGFGKHIVEVFAYGCIDYMMDHGFPLTAEGFEQLVQHSRETGLNGRVAFQMKPWTQKRLQEHVPMAMFGEPIDATRLEKFRARPSLRNRMLAAGLGENDDSLPSEEKERRMGAFLDFLGGDQARPVVQALLRADCQRDLVWKRIEDLLREGDIREKLGKFIEASDQPSD